MREGEREGGREGGRGGGKKTHLEADIVPVQTFLTYSFVQSAFAMPPLSSPPSLPPPLPPTLFLTLKRASSQSSGTFLTYRFVQSASTLCPRLKGSTTTSWPPMIFPFTSVMHPWAEAWREGGREGGEGGEGGRGEYVCLNFWRPMIFPFTSLMHPWEEA